VDAAFGLNWKAGRFAAVPGSYLNHHKFDLGKLSKDRKMRGAFRAHN
jgi:hypothetical protein